MGLVIAGVSTPHPDMNSIAVTACSSAKRDAADRHDSA
jgi:hypothetical protein